MTLASQVNIRWIRFTRFTQLHEISPKTSRITSIQGIQVTWNRDDVKYIIYPFKIISYLVIASYMDLV